MLIVVRLTVIRLSVAILNVVIVSDVGTVFPTSPSNFFSRSNFVERLRGKVYKTFL
jgi:hypothetical protein